MNRHTEPAPTGPHQLTGVVVDEDGGPVTGARVVLAPGPDRVSGEDGRFGFDGLAAGRYRIWARTADRHVDVQLVTVRPGRGPVVLTMRRGATLRVRVHHDGAPVLGARAELDGVVAISDADGVATLRGLGPHFTYVSVSADGLAPASVSLRLDDDPDGAIERTVELRRGALVAGTAVDPDGQPIAGATIELRAGGWPGGCATSDGAGAWTLPMVPAGRYRLRAWSSTHAPGEPLTVEHDGLMPRRDLVIRVDPGAELIGTVVDRAGQPVADATIELLVPDEPTRDVVEGRGDAVGRFALRGIGPGTYDVFAHRGHDASPCSRLTLARGERREVRLVVEPAGIAGVVVDDRGQPVVGAFVSVDAEVVNGDLTDAAGRFDLGGFPPGDYPVHASWPGHELDRIHGDRHTLRAGDSTARLVLPRPATIIGRILLDGVPVRRFGIVVTDRPQFAFNRSPTGFDTTDGRFALRGVSPGSWAIVVAGEGTELEPVLDLDVQPAAVVDVGDVSLARGRRVRGRVVDETGAPVAAACVAVGGRRERGAREDPPRAWFRDTSETVTDDQGRFALEAVAVRRRWSQAGPTIGAWHPAHGASLAHRLDATDDELELVLHPTGAIDGVVAGFADDLGVVHARRRGQPGDVRSASLDQAAAFHFEELPAGEYELQLIVAPGSPAPPTLLVQVSAGERSVARLARG